MTLTLGFTSMDKATETALRAAFDEASAALRDRFTLATDSDARFVIIDMDSMYGPMGWLRLHAAGKQVVALTAAARTQADFRLGRPFDTGDMVELLQQLARSADGDLDAAAPAVDVPDPDPEPAPGPVSAPQRAPDPIPGQPAPAPVQPSPPQSGPAAPGEASTPAAADRQPGPAAGIAPEPGPDPVPVFADWMRPGALTGRLRYRRGDGPELWLDADARQYHGPLQLKPLAAYFEGPVDAADFETVDDDTWSAGSAAAGAPQPMQRLQWLGGLLAGSGKLLPGHDPDGRYQLAKWPQTEREYAHHFRIATAMMKGPATLAEIAASSGSAIADVADFTNANLATGYAEFVPEPEPEPEPAPKPAGFFSRLRRKP